MNLDINIGDVLLGGRYRNKYIKVKSIGTDELGQPIINKDRKLLSVRIEKKLPEGMWSSKTLAEKYKDKDMDKKAYLEDTYDSAFKGELEKISKEKDQKGKRIAANVGSLAVGLPVGATAGAMTAGYAAKPFIKHKAKKKGRGKLTKELGYKKRIFKGKTIYSKPAGFGISKYLNPNISMEKLRGFAVSKKVGKAMGKGIIPGAIVGAVGLKAMFNKMIDKKSKEG